MSIGDFRTLDLEETGPLYPVLIGISTYHADSLQYEGLSVPEVIEAMALIDTGASLTAIDTGITDRLKLMPIDYVNVSSVTEAGVRAPIFDVDLIIEPNQLVVPNIRVVELSLGGGIQCLIGRDILSRMLLIYNGVRNSIILCN